MRKHWSSAPMPALTQAEALTIQCAVIQFVNGTCPPPPPPPAPAAPISGSIASTFSSTASAAGASATGDSSTASPMSSSSGSTANANANAKTDGGATRIDDDNSDSAINAAVSPLRSHWAFAMAIAVGVALMLLE